MALRNIRIIGDELLRKKSRKVDKIDKRIQTLISDMLETMYNADGIGLAAPQVGILKRIVVVDIGEGPLVLINPEIVEKIGNAVDTEGCLSVPNKQGVVERPQKIKVKFMNELYENASLEAEDLLARAICHEVDHLEGTLFIDKAIKMEDAEEDGTEQNS